MAAPFTVFTAADNNLLTSALSGQNSGVTINAGSVILNSSGQGAVNLYDGSLAPLGIGAGLLLTTGTTPGTTNTVGWFGQDNSIYPDTYFNGDPNIDAVVNTVFQTQSFDATTLEFDFTVADPTATSISFDLVFGSDEYPEWVDQFVDSAIVMVNGVNYALFNHDPLHPLSVISSNLAAGYFQYNAVDPVTGLSVLPIEYDGVSHVLKIIAPINTGGAVNHIKIGIADTGDHIYDSGLFIANLTAGNNPGSGIVIAPPVPCTDNSDSVTGSVADEYFDLKAGNDIVYAGGGDDIIVAGSGNDTVYGGTGNDEIKGDAGDDLLDGGDGFSDTVVYAGASTAYNVVYKQFDSSFTVSNNSGSLLSEGTDTLNNIEFAKFSDGLFALGPTGLTKVSNTGITTPINTFGMLAVSGIGTAGNILTATLNDPDGITGTINYQWQVSGDNGASWTDISGAINSTYLLSNNDIGKLIQVTATYVDNASQAESPVSSSKTIFAPKSGDLVVTLMQLDAPSGTSVINPLTTLVKNAIDLGLSPNMAVQTIKTVLGIPAGIKLQTYDAYAVLHTTPNDLTALAVEKVAVQVAILTSLTDDDTGMNLTLAILNAAANNKTLDLASLNDICSIVGIDPLGNIPNGISTASQLNTNISKALADGGNVAHIENEWVDLCGKQDGITSTSIADLSIHVNQAPVGIGSSVLPAAIQSEVYTISSLDLLQGFVDPDGGVLVVSALSTDTGGVLVDNGDGTWSFTPDAGYTGPVELTYTVDDGQGGSVAGSQLLIVTAAANALPTGDVTISGTALQGETLIATNTLADADGIGPVSYQWQADSVDINGATGDTLVLTQYEVDKAITVTASYTDGKGTHEVVGSSVTDPVQNVDDEATGTLIVTGTAEEGGNLTANLSNINDLDGNTTTAYRWQENINGVWTDLAGQSTESLSIPSDQSYVDKSVRVVATTTDDLGGTTDFTGAAQTIANVNDAPTGTVIITGTAQQAQTLSVSNSLADADGLGSISYQWKANGANIAGANGTTLVLTVNEVGKTITVTSSYTDGYGTPESVTSAASATVTQLPGVTLTGTAAADVLNGGTGNDLLMGLAGNDKLNGLAGNDTLDGGAGSDALAGGLGNDTYLIDNTGDKITENLNEGTDIALINIATAAGTYTLANNVENATITSAVAYNLTGNALANILIGNAAANVLNGGAGADILAGGAGNDTYVVDNAADVVSDAINEGTDLVQVGIATAGSSYTLTDNIENATITSTVASNLTGNALANVLTGNAAANTLTGGQGNDNLVGGQGIDTFVVDAGTDTITDLGNGGGDIIKVSSGATVNATVTVVWSATAQTMNNGTANITSSGLAVNLATVTVGNGFNVTNTGKAASFTGSSLDDTLNGGTGIDTLLGGAGNDILIGGAGNDSLTGGAGSDIFRFYTAPGKSNIDIISDFQSGTDKIELLASLFANIKGTDGVFNAVDMLVGAGATKGTVAGNQHLIFNTTTKALYYDADGGGAAAGVQLATLTGVATLADTDFLFV